MALTRNQIEGIVILHNSGMSIRAMAPAIGISPTTLNKYLIDLTTNDDGSINVRMRTGLDGKRRPGRQFDTTARDSQIRELRSSGSSIRTIAAKLDCAAGTVHRVLSG